MAEGKFGKKSFFAYIKKQRELAKEKAIESLEGHNILETLLRDCFDYYNEDTLHDWYHLMVRIEFEEWWLKVWEKYDGKALTDISCSCQTQGGREHKHFIVAFPKGKLTNTFNKAFNAPHRRKINPYLSSEEKRILRGDLRKYYLKPIKTGIHFLHTVLYISTKKTNGFHEGKLMACEHYDHTFLAFDNKKVMNLWRNEVFLPKHPDIRKQMQEEWDMHTAQREMAVLSGDKKIVKNQGLYNGKAIKKTD